jgi:RHS repeat-associated protein
VTTFTTSTYGAVPGGYFTWTNSVEKYLRLDASLGLVGDTNYAYDPITGNVSWEENYTCYGMSCTLYRDIYYTYITNLSPSVWILNTVSERYTSGSNGAISRQQYGYGGNLPGAGSPSTTKPDLSRVVYPNGSQTIDTKYVYDIYGNVKETRQFKDYGVAGSPPSGAYLSYFTYYETTFYTYPTISDPPLLPATVTNYDALGQPVIVTDPNGNQTRTTYDGLGRVTSVVYPGYSWSQPNVQYTYPTPSGDPLAVAAPFAVKMEILDETLDPDDYRSAWQIMDGLGRVIQTQSPYEGSGNANLVLTDTAYNSRGMVQDGGLPRTLFISNPVGAYQPPTWGSVPHTTTAYDALGRTISVTYPDGSAESLSYAGLRTTAIDRNNHKKVQENDSLGRLIKVEEYTGNSAGTYALYATTNYTYDERDLLKTVTDAAGNQTTLTYDGFGRKIEMTDPDMGHWYYQYNVFGNLTRQTDALGQRICMYYDSLNRLTGKHYRTDDNCPTNPTYNVTYGYDAGTNGWGRRTSMSDTSSSSSTSWSYNALGQAIDETHTIEGTPYNIHMNQIDAFSRPLSQTIPSNGGTETLTYSYNAMGALLGLSGTDPYVSQIHYDAGGQVTDQLLGNGLIQQSCYSTTTLRLISLRTYDDSLQSCTVATPANASLNLSYAYQPNGNISHITDYTRSETLGYSYDELDRLLSGGDLENRAYTYDPIGNITSQSSAVQNNPGTHGLAAWWTLNESSGTRNDSYGANHLTDYNTVGSTTGKKSNAADFEKDTLEYLGKTSTTQLQMSTSDIYVGAWIKAEGTLVGNPNVISKLGNTPEFNLRLLSSGQVQFIVRDSSGLNYTIASSTTNISSGQWYYVEGWTDKVNRTVYVNVNNGIPGSATWTVNENRDAAGTTALTLGARDLSGVMGEYWDGLIDEAVYYKRMLTPGERAWLYNQGNGRTYTEVSPTPTDPSTTSLAAWWRLNETSGTRNDSYSSNHLTDYNTVGSATGKQSNATDFEKDNLEYLSKTSTTQLQMSTSDIYVGAWIKAEDTMVGNPNVLSKLGNTPEFNLRVQPSGTVQFIVRDSSGLNYTIASSTTAITYGQWYYVEGWTDKANRTVYVNVNNGVPGSATWAVTENRNGAGNTPLTLGARELSGAMGEYWDGLIDEAVYYKRALTPGERAWLYNAGSGRTYTDLSSPSSSGTTYTYGDSAHKHAVTAVGSDTYSYDANGNMTCRVEGTTTYKQDYNNENLLSAVHKMNGTCASGTVLETTSFVYDGDGNLVKKINPDGTKTIYVGGLYEVDKNASDVVTRTVTYYPAGGAMRINITGGSNSVYYILKDHLGSASVITDSSGNIVGENRYYPYGETRFTSGTIDTDKLFTGQRDVGLGIYHYGARFYSPRVGTFLSPDTIVPRATNPQAWNRYSYVFANPLKYTDPTGHVVADDNDGGCFPCTQYPIPSPQPEPEPEDDDGNDPCQYYWGSSFDYCEDGELKIHGESASIPNLYGYYMTPDSYSTTFYLNGNEAKNLTQILLSGCVSSCTNSYKHFLEELMSIGAGNLPYHVGDFFEIVGLSQLSKSSSQEAFGAVLSEVSSGETETFSPVAVYVDSNYSVFEGNENPLYYVSIIEVNGQAHRGSTSVIESIQDVIVYTILNH